MSRDIKTTISHDVPLVPKVTEITDSAITISLPSCWFLLIEENSEKEHCEFEHILHGKKFIRKEPLAYIRAAFNERREDFVREVVAEDTVLNPAWLRDQPQTTDISLLISCLRICYETLPDLRRKSEALGRVDNALSFEEDVVRQAFLSEMKLPKDAFTFVEGSALQGKVLTLIEKHPVYGEKLKKIRERKVQITSLLLEGQAAEALLTINSFPEYIKILCVRNLIGLEMMVGMSLDDFITVREQS